MSSETAAEICCSYICEICGYIIEDLNNFKLHLKGHDINDNESCLLLDYYQQQQQQVQIQQVINSNDKNIEEIDNIKEDSNECKINPKLNDNNNNSIDYQNCKLI
jgi:hypothetical protein